jgi:hypothetical protein
MTHERTTDEQSAKRGENGRLSRRAFATAVSGTTFAAATTLFGTGAASAESVDCAVDAEMRRLLCVGTEYETPAYIRQADESGPTAVVVGGVHGNERAGVDAAHEIREWGFNRGTLVVLPEANVPAVEDRTYAGPDGDLNQQFPTSEEPTTVLAQEIWNLITDEAADVVIDMHSSEGVWGPDRGPEGFGQAIFPSVAGGSEEIAADVVEEINRHVSDGTLPNGYEFEVGNTLSGEEPRLIHKVAADLDQAGYLTEVTRHDTDLDTQVELTKAMAGALLRRHGIETDYASDIL